MLNNIDVTGLTIERLVELYEQLREQGRTAIEIYYRVETELKRRKWL